MYVCVRFPLTHRIFYDGPWSKDYPGLIDYIVFPMSFIILPANMNMNTNRNMTGSESGSGSGSGSEWRAFDPWSCDERCLQETQLLLSVGVQDRDGWLARLSLGRLLDSLVPVDQGE